jgi:hypothetical protein
VTRVPVHELLELDGLGYVGRFAKLLDAGRLETPDAYLTNPSTEQAIERATVALEPELLP